MYTKREYIKDMPEQIELAKLAQKDPYRLQFHLMSPSGWLNDPNGLCQYQGIHHIYFQYSPFSVTGDTKLWGHYTTSDGIHYKEHVPFLYPDNEFDCDGVYSGCAFVKDDRIHYFYTGNVKRLGGDYDYIVNGREQNTIEFISKDGFICDEKRCLLQNIDYPKDMSNHVRDPKIFSYQNTLYMVLGARTLQDKGCALIYRQTDEEHWEYHMRIETETPFGYMWECPDIVYLDHQWFLICCPQGVKQQGLDYANVYQCGYFPLDLDLTQKTYQLYRFHDLDRGFDIYATQSYLDEDNNRILYGWMGLPDTDYDNEPTLQYSWQHALTLPRILHSQNKRIYQQPLPALQKLRKQKEEISFQNKFMFTSDKCLEVQIQFDYCSEFTLQLYKDILLKYENNELYLMMKESGRGRKIRGVTLNSLEHLQLFLDTSSIEVFVNHGLECFTSRCYRENLVWDLYIQGDAVGKCTWYFMQPFIIEKSEEKTE